MVSMTRGRLTSEQRVMVINAHYIHTTVCNDHLGIKKVLCRIQPLILWCGISSRRSYGPIPVDGFGRPPDYRDEGVCSKLEEERRPLDFHRSVRMHLHDNFLRKITEGRGLMQ
jgi:hypothetical protein